MKKVFLFVCFLIPNIVLGQEVDGKKSKYPLFEFSKGSGDIKNVNWGNYNYTNESYRKALDFYEKISNPNDATKRKMANAYWEIDSLDQALKMFTNIIETSKKIMPLDYYNLSQLLDIKGDYTEANKNRKKYSRVKAREVRVSLFETNENYYEALLSTIGKYELINLSTNTELSDFGGYSIRKGRNKDENLFLFTSSGIQNTGKIKKNKYIKLERPTFNIFSSNFDEEKIQSSNAKILTGDINTAYEEGPGLISENGKTLIFTRSGTASGKDDKLYLNLYTASISNDGAISRVRSVSFNNNQYSVMHPSMSRDGKKIYFSSNMPGGLGGYDLYYVRVQNNNKYSKPVNLGPGINTEGNEVFPFIHREDVLFFASDGHPGLGGLDVYMTTSLGEESQEVINIGAPFNSSKDDFSFFLDKNFKFGFISSNRSGGKGEDDIYSFKINIRPPYGVDDYYTISRGDTLVLSDLGVLVNDGEVVGSNSDVLQALVSRSTILDKDPRNGSLDFNDNGTFTYIHSQLNTKLDSFTYLVSNSALESDPVNVRIKIIDPTVPLAQEDAYLFNENEPLLSDSSYNVLSNDSDPGGDLLKAIQITKPTYGDLVINEDGTFEYTPNTDVVYTSDTAFYAASDGFQSDTSFVVFSKLKVGVDLADIIEINPIYFDFDKSNIRSDAALELDKIVKVMNDYPGMIIELGSHTDCRGNNDYNLSLSDRRAKSSALYVQQRIKDLQIDYKSIHTAILAKFKTKITYTSFAKRMGSKKYRKQVFTALGDQAEEIVGFGDYDEFEEFIASGEISSTYTPRIFGKGYGESTPSFEGNNGCSSLTEDQHQLNRRTEFIIVQIN